MAEIKVWGDVQLPELDHKAGDSDAENRLRHDSYSTKAASTYHTAYYKLIAREKDRLEATISQGMSPSQVGKYMEAWHRCRSDADELERQVKKAVEVMNAARSEMETHSAKKTKVTLQYSLQELKRQLWSSESTLSERGLVLFTQ